jgi:hypothetical protein
MHGMSEPWHNSVTEVCQQKGPLMQDPELAAVRDPEMKIRCFFLKTFTVQAKHRWLTPAILATQEAEIRRILVRSQPRQIVLETLSQKKPSQKGLAEWLKVKALGSSPSARKKRKNKESRGKFHKQVEDM